MDTRVKTRQPGAIPKSIGRQVGVLPLSGGGKLRKGNGDGNIPAGGTDIASDPVHTYPARPPSGSTSHASTRRQSGSRTVPGIPRSTRQGGQDDSDTLNPQTSPSEKLSSSKKKSPSSRISPGTTGSRQTINNPLKKSPGSTSSIHSQYGSDGQGFEPQVPTSGRSGTSRPSPSSSRSSAVESSRKPASSSVTPKRSSRGNLSRQNSSRMEDDDLTLPVDEPEEQDIKFYDVPSQRSKSGSKVKKSPGSADGRQSQHENGKKPYKTIDPEEILAQNMESDLNKIYEICLHASEITHIDNMEKFKKVKVLDLSCNFIEQIQNLEFSRDLKELKLYDNRLRRIDGLENLRDLSSLQLQHNRIKTIGKGLGSLKKLKVLRIDCNQLLKIETAELSQCVQLTTLDISYNMLDSLTALNYLPNLGEVNASGNRLRSVSDLSKCKQLQEIDLSGNRLTELSGLRGLPKLMTLNISNNQLSSLKTMGRLRSLQDLLAGTNHIHELSTVRTQMPVLETLDLTNNEITDWDEFYYLDEMSDLVELFIAGNPFCAQDGTMPHYFSAIQAVLPNLEIIDGAHIKKHVSKGAPLMRPMSASTIVSLRQMDTQMRSADDQMKSLEKSLEEKFASLRATCDSLPLESPSSRLYSRSSELSDDTPVSSRCNSRNRILQARKFAASVDRK